MAIFQTFFCRSLLILLVLVTGKAFGANLVPLTDAQKEKAIHEYIDMRAEQVDPETGLIWGTHGSPKGYHATFEKGTPVRSTMQGMTYALYLLASSREKDQQAGRNLLRFVIDLQDKNPESRTFGVWSWYYEEPLNKMPAVDYNWSDFLGSLLVTILHDYSDRLDEELLRDAKTTLEYASRAIIKRNVGPGYTNIAMKGAAVTAAAGELLGRKDFLEYGRNRIKRNLDHYRSTGGFVEYNSPDYQMIVIHELEGMLQYVKDPECRETAEILLHEIWKGIALHYHQPTGQWGGPHSRAYSDLLPSTTHNTLLYRVGILDDPVLGSLSPFEKPVPAPEEYRHFFERPVTELGTRVNHYVTRDKYRDTNGTFWLDENMCLGSASYHTFWMQAHGLIAYFKDVNGEPASLRLHFEHNGNDFASGVARNMQKDSKVLTAVSLLNNRGSMHPYFDCPRNATFKARSFRIVYRLNAAGAKATQIDACRYQLETGSTRAVVHICPESRFDGMPIQWSVRNEEGRAEVIGVCYEGEEKEFAFNTFEVSIATALELLGPGDSMSADKVQILKSDVTTSDCSRFYEVQWTPVTDAATSLVAPAQATKE